MQPGPSDTAQQAWQRIFTNPQHTGQTWACLAVAISHADTVLDHAQRGHPPAADPGLSRGGPLWTQVAVSGYTMLTGTGAYAHRGVDLPGRFLADQTAIRTWLKAPEPASADGQQTVADRLDVTGDLLLDGDARPARVANLLASAQAAGVLRCPNSRLELWHLADDTGAIVGHRLAVYRDNLTLASERFQLTDLIDETLLGVAAATAAITHAAERANQTLAAAAADTGTAPPVAGVDQPRQPGWVKGFRVGARPFTPAGGATPATAPPPGPAPGRQPPPPHAR